MALPFPEWYDSNVYYEYHLGITRHFIDDNIAFKVQVHCLIKHIMLQFKKSKSLIDMEINSVLDHEKGEDKGMNM